MNFVFVSLLLLNIFVSRSECKGFSLNGTLVVVEKSGNRVHFVNLTDGSSQHRIAVGRGPHEIGAWGDIGAVPNYGSRNPATMSILNIATQRLTRTLNIPNCVAPHHAEFIDSRRVVLACDQSRDLLIVDVITGQVEQRISTSPHMCHLLVMNPNSDLLFCTSMRDGFVVVVNIATGRMVRAFYSGNTVEGLDFSPDGSVVWAANRAENTISVIDVTTLQITTKFRVPGITPIRVKFTKDGSTAIVTNAGSDTVTFYDVETQAVISDLPISGAGTGTIGTLVIDDQYLAIAAHRNGEKEKAIGEVNIIDMSNLSIVLTMRLFDGPDGMAFIA